MMKINAALALALSAPSAISAQSMSMSMATLDAELSMSAPTIVSFESKADVSAMSDDYYYSFSMAAAKSGKAPKAPMCYAEVVGEGTCLDSSDKIYDALAKLGDYDLDSCLDECAQFAGMPGSRGMIVSGIPSVTGCACLFDSGMLPSPTPEGFDVLIGSGGTGEIIDVEYGEGEICVAFFCEDAPAGKAGKAPKADKDYSFSMMDSKSGKATMDDDHMYGDDDFDFSMGAKSGKAPKGPSCYAEEVGPGSCIDEFYQGYDAIFKQGDYTAGECISDICAPFASMPGSRGLIHTTIEPINGCACLFDNGMIPDVLPPDFVTFDGSEGFGPIMGYEAAQGAECFAYVCEDAPAGKAGKAPKPDEEYSFSMLEGKAGKGMMMESKAGKGGKLDRCVFENPSINFAESIVDDCCDGEFEPALNLTDFFQGAFAMSTEEWIDEGATAEDVALFACGATGVLSPGDIDEEATCLVVYSLVGSMFNTCFYDDYKSAYVNVAAAGLFGFGLAQYNTLECSLDGKTFKEWFGKALDKDTIDLIESSVGTDFCFQPGR